MRKRIKIPPHPFAALIAEIEQPRDAALRKILDTADEIEQRTGVRPDVRGEYLRRCKAQGSSPVLPEWFK